MSEYMRPIDFEKLIRWALEEYKNEGSIFSLSEKKFYRAKTGKTLVTSFGEEISTPIGPAAGPHTQLAQNIITSYLAGSRYIELKTVQIMDGEDIMKEIPKPCIIAEDEAYNCEWSTELRVDQALEEYIKAHIALIVLAKELNISDKKDFILNMSVGYNLEGIKSEKIDNFIESMKDAKDTKVFKEAIGFLKDNIDLFENVSLEDIDNISSNITTNMTLSTMHGCPADEIFNISKYLIEEKDLHTFVKCNPTLVGYDYARSILDDLSYSYIEFDKEGFDNDISFDKSVEIFKKLLEIAKENKLSFGVKISNTFPVIQKKGELPADAMYMSGRALLPLTLKASLLLSEAFDGKLPMSYCGGADYFNIYDLFKIFNQPITVSTTLLKPGGYYRLNQLAKKCEDLLGRKYEGVLNTELKDLVDKLKDDDKYKKDSKNRLRNRKWLSDLPITDCYKAPCEEDGCPINQQVAAYMHYAEKKDFKKAMEVIAIDNSAPSILSETCYQFCKKPCTRVDYDKGLGIREVKGLITDTYQDEYIKTIEKTKLKTKDKAIVIGAGPAGIGVGLFLRRNGLETIVVEKSTRAYGYANELVSDEAVKKDLALARKIGVDIRLGEEVDLDIDKLKKDYKYIIIATGKDSDYDKLKKLGFSLNDKNKPNLLANNESNIENIYFAGDIRKNRKSIVDAIKDAKIITKDILAKEGLGDDFIKVDYEKDFDEIILKRGDLKDAKPRDEESQRCLSCDKICEVCTEVCPNRANVVIRVDGFKNKRQTIHLDGLCNECGNCESFCPHRGAPYKDKFTVFIDKKDFDISEQTGFIKLDDDKYLVRLANKNVVESTSSLDNIDETMRILIKTIEESYPYYL